MFIEFEVGAPRITFGASWQSKVEGAAGATGVTGLKNFCDFAIPTGAAGDFAGAAGANPDFAVTAGGLTVTGAFPGAAGVTAGFTITVGLSARNNCENELGKKPTTGRKD